jgi:hypothetical protein
MLNVVVKKRPDALTYAASDPDNSCNYISQTVPTENESVNEDKDYKQYYQ